MKEIGAELITGQEAMEQFRLQPFDLVVLMAVGLEAKNARGDYLTEVARELVEILPGLRHEVVCGPDSWWRALSDGSSKREVPARYKSGGGLNKDLLFEDLPGAVIRRDVLVRLLEERQACLKPTPESEVKRLKSQGLTDKEIAARLDETFTGPDRLSHCEMGKLLPASNAIVAKSTPPSRGRWLRGLKK